MSITYEEALSTLTSMFGVPWTTETLDAVLRHHQGHMENTVESILSHGQGDPQDLVRKLKNPELASGCGAKDQISMDEEIARQLARESDGPGGIAAARTSRRVVPAPATSASNTAKKGRGTPTELPPDFLRIPGRSYGSNTINEDEQLARMLQDELFTQELANNPEFAHLARGGRGVGVNHRTGRQYGGAAPHNDFGKDFMKGLSDLGENAKKRLQLIAANFNAKQNGNSASGGAGGSSGRGERRSLLDGSGDDDEVSFGNQGNEMEMQSMSPPSLSLGGFGMGGSKKEK